MSEYNVNQDVKINNLEEKFVLLNNNLLDSITFSENNAIAVDDGDIYISNNYYATIDYIAVQPNYKYIYNYMRNGAIYDSNKNYLYSTADYKSNHLLTVPSDGYFIRYCVTADEYNEGLYLKIYDQISSINTDNFDEENAIYIPNLYNTYVINNKIDNIENMVINGEYKQDFSIITNSFIKTTGEYLEQYQRSDYIEIPSAVSYFYLYDKDNSDGICQWVSFHDENKEWLLTQTVKLDKTINNIPVNNAKYIVIGHTSLSRLQGIELYFILRNENTDTDNDLKLTLGYNNLIDICFNNAYIGSGLHYSTNYFYTDYIAVEPGEVYKANKGRNWAYYDSDKNFVSNITGTEIQSSITIPNDVYYIRFTINKSTDNCEFEEYKTKLYFAKYSEYDPSSYYLNGIKILSDNTSNWYEGKKINWIGDSIVDGPDFDEMVCTALGLIETDYGINGSTVAINESSPSTRTPLAGRYQEMTDDADIIAVSIGTNDFQYSFTDIGTIDDTTPYTFYGGLKVLCEGLLNKYPGKIIFFTTPIKRGQPFSGSEENTNQFSRNAKGKTLKEYCDIIKEVCSYYSIPVCDLYSESLLNPYLPTQTAWFDNVLTHPNDTARKMMARRICGWLQQLSYNIE